MLSSTRARTSTLSVLAFCALLSRLIFAQLDVDPQATDVLKRWLTSEYSRYHFNREDLSLEQKSALMAAAQNIMFTKIEARGKPEHMMFRVELAPNPARPPNSPEVRYFKMEHSLMMGWQTVVPRSSNGVLFFFALFRF